MFLGGGGGAERGTKELCRMVRHACAADNKRPPERVLGVPLHLRRSRWYR
jgi:hypothetical protein